MKEFMIGCNYWASNAGMYMWRNFDASIVEKDFALLASYGVDTVRVFPLWDDFQPVKKMHVSNKVFTERTGDTPLQTYGGLDKKQIENFSIMLDLAEKYNLKVIVALITGWMSGRLFYPEILMNENPLTSPKAIVWETRFISEFIPHFKDRKCIIAWEPGNECNVLDGTLPNRGVNREQAELWLSSITNAIRAADNTRPVYAGMHGLGYNCTWELDMVAHYTEMQTTHPYPLFTDFCDIERVTSMRAALHSAAESVYYGTTTNRPCLVEEVGTLGPMVISDDYADEYVEKSLFSSYQYGTTGYLWWCAFDQDVFEFAPYDGSGLERNLGLAYSDGTAKPVLRKMKEMQSVLSEIGEIAPYQKDIEVILTSPGDAWKNAYGAFCLAAQAGYGVAFSYRTSAIRKAHNYCIPCVRDDVNLKYLPALLSEIESGATLLISYDGGHLGSFEKLTGVKVKGRDGIRKNKNFTLNGKSLSVSSSADLILAADTAEVLIECEGNILLSRNKVGTGYVYFLNCALENNYTQGYNPQDTALSELYRYIFGGREQVIAFESDKLCVTFHDREDGKKVVLITNFDNRAEIKYSLAKGYKIECAKYCEINGGMIKFLENYAYLLLNADEK